jgi:hypothetical protein
MGGRPAAEDGPRSHPGVCVDVAGVSARAEIRRMNDWSVLRIRGDRGAPTLGAVQFIGCIQAIRPALGETRWHFRWEPVRRNTEYDGLRIEAPFGSPAQQRITQAFEGRIPPPDTVISEPLRPDVDLDPIQSEAELETCLDMLCRFSEFVLELRKRNSGVQARQIQGLTPGALLTFVTGDRRHLERALEDSGIGSLPAVPFSRFMSELSAGPLSYRIPPRSRKEAVDTARIHHLTGCTFASGFYPIAKAP